MTLSNWIESIGPEKLAKNLNVAASTISSWKTLSRAPRVHQMVKIHRLSKGRVTYKSMVESFANAKK